MLWKASTDNAIWNWMVTTPHTLSVDRVNKEKSNSESDPLHIEVTLRICSARNLISTGDRGSAESGVNGVNGAVHREMFAHCGDEESLLQEPVNWVFKNRTCMKDWTGNERKETQTTTETFESKKVTIPKLYCLFFAFVWFFWGGFFGKDRSRTRFLFQKPAEGWELKSATQFADRKSWPVIVYHTLTVAL